MRTLIKIILVAIALVSLCVACVSTRICVIWGLGIIPCFASSFILLNMKLNQEKRK